MNALCHFNPAIRPQGRMYDGYVGFKGNTALDTEPRMKIQLK